jgi:hypothetical protein
MSADKENPADAIACLAASAALAVSDIPFGGPVSEVRVARVNGKMILNPTHRGTEGADLDLIVAGTKSDILMVEGEMKEVQEADMIEAIKVAHDAIKKQCIALEELSAMVPKSQTKRTYNHENNDEAIGKKIMDFCYQKYYDYAMEPSARKRAWTNSRHQGGMLGHLDRRGEGRQGHARSLLQEDPEEGCPQRVPGSWQAPRWSQDRSDPPDLERSGRTARNARQRHLHAW